MSDIGRAIGRPLMAVVALGYFSLLAVFLILWHMSPVLVLAFTLGGIGLMMIALRPYWGLHVFVMILFFENDAATGEGVTAMQVIGAIIFSGWLLNVALRRKSPGRLNSLTLLGLLFVAWCAATLPGALDVGAATHRVLSFTQMLVASLMFASVVDDRDKARGIFTAIVIWTFVATLIALGQYYLGVTPVAVGPVGNRNLLATYINCGIVCAYLLHQATAHRAARILLALSLPVFFLGLELTFSRTGLIVQTLALVLVWYRVVREKGFMILTGSMAALCLIALLLPAGFYKRARTIVPAIQRQEDTFGTRVRVWKTGLRMIQDRPIFGVGAGNFSIGVQRYNRGEVPLVGLGAHNAYVGVAAETGLVGVGLFVGLLLAALARARQTLRAARAAQAKDLEMFAIMNEITLLVFCMSGLSGSVEGLKYLWLLLGMSFALGKIISVRAGALLALRAASQEHVGSWKLAPGDSK